MRVAAHVVRLAARVPVAVDDEAARIELFHEHHARRDVAVGQGCRGQRYGFGLVHVGGLRGGEPGVELGEWGGREVREFECVLGILDGFGGVGGAAGGREDEFGGGGGGGWGGGGVGGVDGVGHAGGFLRL